MIYSSLDPNGRAAVMITIPMVVYWFGGAGHSVIELPSLTALGPGSSILGLIAPSLHGVYLFSPFSRMSGELLFTWGLLELVGGLVTVPHLGFRPFVPEQNVTHQVTHVFYASAELPLVIITLRLIRDAGNNGRRTLS